ncbi:MAG: hypothetical protein CMJ78_27015 [Planctomycetaceae bacterium]|nr:hypothetical protein [Planctomycetaceae bacterium]
MSSFHEWDAKLGWRGKANFEGRFRLLENASTADDSKRVFVFGDSFTWGWGVDQGQCFADQMAARLPSYSVENFGICGCGTIHQYEYFERHVRSRLNKGDIVVIAFYGNDFRDNLGMTLDGHLAVKVDGDQITEVVPPRPTNSKQFKHWLKGRCYVFNLASYLTDSWKMGRRHQRIIEQQANQVAAAPQKDAVLAQDSEMVQVAKHYLEKFQADCEASDARLLVTYIPGRAEIDESELQLENIGHGLQRAYHDALTECCQSLDIEVVELEPAIAEAKQRKECERVTFRNDMHWNEHGHRICGRVLANHIGDDSVVRSAKSNPETRIR